MKTLKLATVLTTAALCLAGCNNVDRSATKGTDQTPDALNTRDQPKFTPQAPGQSPHGAEADTDKKDGDPKQP